MKKLLLFVMACMPLTMQAQDRLLPMESTQSATLPDGTRMLCRYKPSMMKGWTLCWDKKNKQLISDGAEKLSLGIPAKTGKLIEQLVDAAVSTAVPQVYKEVVLDGSTSTYFSGEKQAIIHSGAGLKIDELNYLFYAINKAVTEGDTKQINVLVPRIKALTQKLQDGKEDAVYECSTGYYGTSRNGVEYDIPRLRSARLVINWKGATPENATPELRHENYVSIQARRDAYIRAYEKELIALTKSLYRDPIGIAKLYDVYGPSIQIHVSDLPDITPTLVKHQGLDCHMILPASKVVPSELKTYLQGLDNLPDNRLFLFDGEWKAQPQEEYNKNRNTITEPNLW